MELDSEADIVKKYKKYPEFKRDLDQIQSFYNGCLNLALYEDLEREQSQRIFELVDWDNSHRQLLLFYGHRYKGTQSKDLEKLYRLYIRSLDEPFRTVVRKYSVVFFNCLCSSNDAFSAFKSIYKTLPIMYYSKLEKIYIVSPSLSVKSLDWIVFGRLNKLFSKRLEFVASLEDLAKYNLPKKFNDILPQEILSFSSQGMSEVPQKKPPEPQVKHISPFEVLKIPLEKYEMSDERVPRLLKLLVMTFVYQPKFLELEGIFRKSGSIEQEEDLVRELFNRNEKFLELVTDGYVIAGVVKKIFTNLTQPIFPYAIYDKIMNINGVPADQEVEFVKSLLRELPQLNYCVILFMCTFLKEKVIRREALNKMTNYNCAVVFAPCFLRPKNYELADLMCSGKLVKVLLILFSRFEEVFGKAVERMEVFRRSAQKANKDLFEQKRASTQSPPRKSREDKLPRVDSAGHDAASAIP